jgi:hypothetical protein
MTPEEWDGCEHPKAMLEVLRGSGLASHRKLRLFMAACCRRVIHTFTEVDDLGREEAIGVAERYADGLADEEEREEAFADLTDGGPHRLWDDCTNLLVADFTQEEPDDADAVDLAVGAAEEARLQAVNDRYEESEEIEEAEAVAQTGLVREVFGNPGRPVVVDRAWTAWNGAAAKKLARAVYEERELPGGHLDAARLAVLADMLEEAGCANAGLLGHLRGPGPHVLGCWALDAVLGKT